jgi:hypothetical protein
MFRSCVVELQRRRYIKSYRWWMMRAHIFSFLNKFFKPGKFDVVAFYMSKP